MLGRVKDWYRARQNPAPQPATSLPADHGIFVMEVTREGDAEYVVAINPPSDLLQKLEGRQSYRTRTGKRITTSPLFDVQEVHRSQRCVHYRLTPAKDCSVEKTGEAKTLGAEHDLYSQLARRGLAPNVRSFAALSADEAALKNNHAGLEFTTYLCNFWGTAQYASGRDEAAAATQQLGHIMCEALQLKMDIDDALGDLLTEEQKQGLLQEQYQDLAAKTGAPLDAVRQHQHAYRMMSALDIRDSGFIERAAPLERLVDAADAKYGGCYWDGNPSNILVDKDDRYRGIDFNNLSPKSLPESLSSLLDEPYVVPRIVPDPQGRGLIIQRPNCIDENDRAAMLQYCVHEHNARHPERPITSMRDFATGFYAARIVTSVRNFGYAARKAKTHAEDLGPQAKQNVRETLEASEHAGDVGKHLATLYNARQRMRHFKTIAMQSLGMLEAYAVPQQERPAIAALREELGARFAEHECVISPQLDRLCDEWTNYSH